MINTLFYNSYLISPSAALWFVIPLCLAVTIVYKTVRIKNIRKLPIQSALLMGYLLGCLLTLGVGLWLIQTIFL